MTMYIYISIHIHTKNTITPTGRVLVYEVKQDECVSLTVGLGAFTLEGFEI